MWVLLGGGRGGNLAGLDAVTLQGATVGVEDRVLLRATYQRAVDDRHQRLPASSQAHQRQQAITACVRACVR